ncbi:hypothetical protein HNR46_000332 [Haloferula luteola]|uniref:Uncharacterized protein n=1 Tax=Haloferula luteola TaxID=595692 RepID=A0A840VB43_9BACT|nr:hypothetical protein [Haloferula luteola]MBB5350111.1 hypothetical protein [Haloferula luteola]
MSDFDPTQGTSPENPRAEYPVIPPRHVDEPNKLKKATDCACERLQKLTWPEIAVAAVAGFAIGWLVASPRRHPTLGQIVDDSLRPWASRGLNDAFDTMRHSRPVHLVQDGISKLRAS